MKDGAFTGEDKFPNIVVFDPDVFGVGVPYAVLSKA